MLTVAYVGNFGFPDKNASGKRVLGNCKALLNFGYNMICVCPGKSGKYQYEDITVYSLDRGGEIQRVLKNQLKEIKNILKEEKVDCVILYGAIFTEIENLKLIKWCHQKGISIVYDQVDWLDLNWHNPLRGIIRALNHHLMNNYVIPNCDGIICISSYLKKYHSKNSVNILVVPPLSIEQKNEVNFNMGETLRLVYSGTTSDIRRPMIQWKDRIDIMLEKLYEVSQRDFVRKFVLDIYGMTKERYLAMFPLSERKRGELIVNKLGTSVVFHGNVSNFEAIQEIKKADFTLLIRDKKRSTMSGFPTKISESISCGIPVLCNDTSDISNYIINGKNGFVMDDIKKMLKKALLMSNNDITKMKKECCDSPFFFKKYQDKLGIFIEKIIQKRRNF